MTNDKPHLVITSGPASDVVTGHCSVCGSLFIRDDGNGDRLLDDFAEHTQQSHEKVKPEENAARRPL